MPGLHIDHFIAGLHTNRAATSVPFRFSYGKSIQYFDALIDGSNMEMSPRNTLVRRPGWTKYCSVTYGSDTPQNFAAAILNGTLYDFLATNQKVYTFGTSALTAIYTKATTNQTFFQQVGNLIFFSDGNANKKYDGNNVTNNGITPPSAAPFVTNLNLYDAAGATQTLHAWCPGASYSGGASGPLQYFILAPTGEIYWTVIPQGAKQTSQTTAPNWASGYNTTGYKIVDGAVNWYNCGLVGTWAASTGSPTYFNSAYPVTLSYNSSLNDGGFTTSGSSGISANWQTWAPYGAPYEAYWNTVTGVGTSNIAKFATYGFNIPSTATINGIAVSYDSNTSYPNTVTDYNVQLLKAGVASGSNKALTSSQWYYSAANKTFGQRNYGSNTDLWGTTWAYSDINNANFGVQIQVSVNSSKAIAATITAVNITVYYTISSGALTGTATASVILDSNGNLQRAKTLGTTGGSAPSWSTTIGGTTTDGGMTWECLGTGSQLPCLFQWNYAYSWHTNSAHTSTCSPLLTLYAPLIGVNVPVSGAYCTDTQCDSCDVYRTTDGGAVLLFDSNVPNNQSGGTWTDYDTDLDTALNATLIGPIALANNPPPSGLTILASYMGRLWGAVGNLLYFSAGPDCINGDGQQAWPPANVFTLPAPINALISTVNGLVVITGNEIQMVMGGPQLYSFWLQPLMQNIGVQSPNCAIKDDSDIILYTSQQTFVTLSASSNDETGLVIAPTLASNFTATGAYIAVHKAGADKGTFISDNSTHVMRWNPQAQSWDTLATMSSIGPLASIDTVIGTRNLMSTQGGYIVKRDPTSWLDSGSSYTCYATIGSIPLSEYGEGIPSALESLLVVGPQTGTRPTVSVLCNEISGAFTSIPFNVDDPWQLTAPSSLFAGRYDWKGAASFFPDVIRNLQIKISFSSENYQGEVYSVHLI